MNISDIGHEMEILNIPSNAFSIGDPTQDESLCIREKMDIGRFFTMNEE